MEEREIIKATAVWLYEKTKRKFVRSLPLDVNEEEPFHLNTFSLCSDIQCEQCLGEENEAHCIVVPAEEPLMHHYHESSYLSESKPKRYSHRWVLDYDRFSPSQLKRIVLDRGLHDPFPLGLTIKYYYIRKLEQADRQWSFRLMDQPPEMRMHVYRPLLIAQTRIAARDMFHPAILRANKQVNKEARSILYHENVFTLEYQLNVGPSEHNHSIKILNQVSLVYCERKKFLGLPLAIENYPDFLRHISHLEISLSYSVSDDNLPELSVNVWDFNNCLLSLASFLVGYHSLKKLRVKIKDWPSAEATDEVFLKVFYPLLRVRNIGSVILSDRLPVRVAARLRKDLQSSQPAFNTMRQWTFLATEAEMQCQLLHIIKRNGCYCTFTSGGVGNYQAIVAADFEVDAGVTEAFGSRRKEDQFIAKLSRLRHALDKFDVDELTAAVNGLERTRRMRNSFLNTADHEVLEEAENRWLVDDAMFQDLQYGSEDQWSDDEGDKDAGATTMIEDWRIEASGER